MKALKGNEAIQIERSGIKSAPSTFLSHIPCGVRTNIIHSLIKHLSREGEGEGEGKGGIVARADISGFYL